MSSTATLLLSYPKRHRLIYFLGIFFFFAIGISSRKYGSYIPDFFAKYTGDYIAGWMAWCLWCTLLPKQSIRNIALLSLSQAYLMEFSQLIHTAWLDEARHTFIGHMILGQGFLWSDIICNTVGIGTAVVVELMLLRKSSY